MSSNSSNGLDHQAVLLEGEASGASERRGASDRTRSSHSVPPRAMLNKPQKRVGVATPEATPAPKAAPSAHGTRAARIVISFTLRIERTYQPTRQVTTK